MTDKGATMSGATTDNNQNSGIEDIIRIPREKLDKLLIAVGAVAALVFAVAGGLLSWGAGFSNDYVHDELGSQNITIPDEATLRADASLTEDELDALLEFAGEPLTTGVQAQAYAGMIGAHVRQATGGMTYAELGGPESAARAAVTEARDSGASDAEIEALEGELAEVSGQRDTAFRGETLRGLLLSSFAWYTIGQIAGIASWVAYGAAVVMAVLVVLGLLNLRRNPPAGASTQRA